MPEPSSAETLTLELRVSPNERAALRSVLLAARSSELAELQRRGLRLSLGYGTESAREGMSDEVAWVRLRIAMLDRLLAALAAVAAAATDPAFESSEGRDRRSA